MKTRTELLGIDLELGREGAGPLSNRIKKLGLYLCPGRVCLDYSNYGYSYDDNGWGIAGLVERSQFACLPPSIAGRWTANRVNDSRICFELIKRGHVIPRNRGAFEFVRSLSEIHQRDRGGMILSPKIKEVHYNVAELDFDSLYPNLIIKRNISFETVTPSGVDTCLEDAILPFVTKKALERRLYFKRLRKSFPRGFARMDLVRAAPGCSEASSGMYLRARVGAAGTDSVMFLLSRRSTSRQEKSSSKRRTLRRNTDSK